MHHRSKINSVYNLTWRMSCGSVDLPALRTAWQAVHDRHDALRTGLRQRDGVVSMLVQPDVNVDIERVLVPWTASGTVPVAGASTSADELLGLIAEELHERPFELNRPPLTRLTVVSVADRHELVLTIHHSMIDGWGMQLLLSDLSQAYRNALDRNALTDEPLSPSAESPSAEPASFADYGLRSQAAREKGRWQPGIEHWRTALSGATSSIVVPDRELPPRAGGRGEVLRHVFGQAAKEGVTAAAQQASATPFAVLLAAFQAMLARGGAGPDVAVGVATANRLTKRDQALVGYVSNVCISRAQVQDSDTFADLVARAKASLWTMLAYQDVPFPLVFGALDEQDKARLRDVPPLLLSYYGPIAAGLRLGDLPLEMLPSPNRAARSDISFGLLDLDDGYAVDVEYDTERYDRQTVQGLLADIDSILAAAARPDTRVADLMVKTRTAAESMPGGTAADHEATRPANEARPAEEAQPQRQPDALERVYQMWAEVLGSQPADPDEDFFASIGRSIKAIELVAAIEADSGQEFDVESWLAKPTPGQIARLLAPLEPDTAVAAPEPFGASEPSTLVELRGGDGPHVHLLPGAAATAGSYAELIEVLPVNWRLTISQEQGLLASVADMAERYRADLAAAGLRPDLLVGWSVGGQVAYQMATGYEPAPAVALLDAPPPVGYSLTDDEVRRAFTAALLGALGGQPGAATPRIEADGPDVHLRVLAAYLATAGQAMPFAMLTQRWRAYGRHLRAAAVHRGDQCVTAPALVIAAELADVQVDQWAQRFEPPPRRLRLATNHTGVVREPAVREVGAAIAALAGQATATP